TTDLICRFATPANFIVDWRIQTDRSKISGRFARYSEVERAVWVCQNHERDRQGAEQPAGPDRKIAKKYCYLGRGLAVAKDHGCASGRSGGGKQISAAKATPGFAGARDPTTYVGGENVSGTRCEVRLCRCRCRNEKGNGDGTVAERNAKRLSKCGRLAGGME